MMTKTLALSLVLSCLCSSCIYAQTIYVNLNAVNGTNTGESWPNAYTDLQNALETATAGQEIWVAAGTYYPTMDMNRDIHFELKSGVRLLGGFSGNETSVTDRDWTNNATVLSADIGTAGISTDNSYTILYLDQTDATTTIDGFTLEGGNADNDEALESFMSPRKNGGAISYSARGLASGLFMLIDSSEFIGNAGPQGSTLSFFKTSSGMANLEIDHSLFQENFGTSVINAGTNQNNSDDTRILNSIFIRNNTDVIRGDCDELSNCIFINNEEAIQRFGSAGGDSMLIANCTFFSDNPDLNNSINIRFKTTIYNSIFYQANPGDDPLITSNQEVNVKNCLFSFPDCEAAILALNNSSFSCQNNIYNADPLFEDPANNDLRLNACSPAIDAGDNSLYNVALRPFDFAGKARIMNDRIEIGAYEAVPNVFIDEVIPVLCNGESTGAITLAFMNPGPYFYQWDNGQATGGEIENLAAGMYTLTVIDGKSCAIETSFEVTENPALVADFDFAVPVSCFGASDGFASVEASGGVAPYTFEWDNGMTDSDAFMLDAGYRTVSITDANNCLLVDSVLVLEPIPITVESTIEHASSSTAADGSIELSNIDGLPPFTFLWNTGATTDFIENLSPGEYTVVITDPNGCSFTMTYTVSFVDATDEALAREVQMYPNPTLTKGRIYLTLPSAWSRATMKLYDTMGRVVQQEESGLDNQNVWITSPEVVGLYWLELTYEEQTVFKKIVVVDQL